MKNFLTKSIDQVWNVSGNFDAPSGDVKLDENGLFYDGILFHLKETLISGVHGVFSRKDTLHNISETPLHISALRARFLLDGDQYEVYTQYNGWQNESLGSWSHLSTEITARCESVRTSSGAAPFMALWNPHTNRGIAFHLLADASWSMAARRVAGSGETSHIIVEMGIDAPNLALQILPGETFDMPEILYYEIRNKTDMDCWKLHRYCNDRFPRRQMPVIYNTWLYKFDKFDCDNIAAQIPVAADLGAEYFVIDAGWFGINPSWDKGIGDWTESHIFGFKGKMQEISDLVRSHSMKFGLWLETERAVTSAKVLEEHAKYYIKSGDHYFLDYSNPDARKFIFKTISRLIKQYGIEFIKFDFNADLTYDKKRSAFTEYFKGYRLAMKQLREAFPHVYLQNCASGGMRMNLTNCLDFDSFWLSDNQSPYDGMRIVKDTMLRMPPQAIERWATVGMSTPIFDYANNYTAHLVATADATWGQVMGVHTSYLKGFLSGSPIGFSCDLTALSPDIFRELKEYVAQFKADRDFWIQAECRILIDTEALLVLEYSDRELKKNVVQIFSRRPLQSDLQIYPMVDMDATYVVEEADAVESSSPENLSATVTGQTLALEGLTISLDGNYQMKAVTLRAVTCGVYTK